MAQVERRRVGLGWGVKLAVVVAPISTKHAGGMAAKT